MEGGKKGGREGGREGGEGRKDGVHLLLLCCKPSGCQPPCTQSNVCGIRGDKVDAGWERRMERVVRREGGREGRRERKREEN